MNKKSFDYCPRDYKNHHCWTRVGVDRGMIIYQCNQCRKCSFEKIVMLGNLFPKDNELLKRLGEQE